MFLPIIEIEHDDPNELVSKESNSLILNNRK